MTNDDKNHIERNWQEFRVQVIPEGASEAQVSATRTAFFAGATTALCVIADHSNDEARAVSVVNEMHEEIKAFFDIQMAKFTKAH